MDMGRPLRIQSSEAYQHITARGNDRQDIFLDREDFEFYLEQLELARTRFEVELACFVLMTNHLHQLARFALKNMDAFVKHLHGLYARHFNKRYGRVGHVFEKRYDAREVRNETYLHEAGRYIHMNPVDADIVPSPEDYPWSSFERLWGGEKGTPGVSEVLTRPFAASGAFEPEEFHAFTSARHRARYPEDSWYTETQYKKEAAQPRKAAAPAAMPILSCVEDLFRLERGELSGRSHGHRIQNARAIASMLLRRKTALTLTQIAIAVGLSFPASVVKAIARAEHILRADEALRCAVMNLG